MAHGDTGKAARRPARTRRALASALAAAAAALGLFVLAQPAQASASGASCVAATSGAHVHFLTDFATGSPDGSVIAGLTIDGFDAAACDGLPVAATIMGNAAGSAGAPASELLSTLDSTLVPCTGAKLGAPVTISGGSITLNGCATVHDPSGAAYASLHDATQLTVKVADAVIPAVIGGVATTTSPSITSTSPTMTISNAGSGASSSHGVGGVSASRSGSGSSGTGGQASGHHGLADTGVDVALLTFIGLVLIIWGALLLRRRTGNRA